MTKKEIIKILIKINPNIEECIKKKAHFLNDGYLDSFSIVQFVLEVELLIKKKINMKNIKRDYFSNVDNILKFINKQ
jgi:acyl carrier protein